MDPYGSLNSSNSDTGLGDLAHSDQRFNSTESSFTQVLRFCSIQKRFFVCQDLICWINFSFCHFLSSFLFVLDRNVRKRGLQIEVKHLKSFSKKVENLAHRLIQLVGARIQSPNKYFRSILQWPTNKITHLERKAQLRVKNWNS